MKKITQTGNIPINSISLLIGNYFRYFKVFFVFWILPTFLFLLANFFLNKEKFIAIYNNLIAVIIAASMHNSMALDAVKTAFTNSFASLTSSPAYIVMNILSWLVMFVFMSCLLVGIKHTFYEKVSIIAIFKEGIKKFFNFLWTSISMSVLLLITIICFGALLVLPAYILGDSAQIILILPVMIGMIFIVSMFAFYMPLHFFSDNNPLSCISYSVKTFFSNILSLIVMFFAALLVQLIISGIIAAIGFICFTLFKNGVIRLDHITPTFIYIVSAVVISAMFFMPYFTNIMHIMLAASTFVAYPELIEEEAVYSGTYEKVPENFSSSGFAQNYEVNNNSAVRIDNTPIQQNYVIGNEDTSSFKTTTGAEGLSVPNTHKSNRPFLNQKLDQTEFDRLTSKQ